MEPDHPRDNREGCHDTGEYKKAFEIGVAHVRQNSQLRYV
jgi:hypothetical protein